MGSGMWDWRDDSCIHQRRNGCFSAIADYFLMAAPNAGTIYGDVRLRTRTGVIRSALGGFLDMPRSHHMLH